MTEAVFIETEMNNEWNDNFLQNTNCGKYYPYSGFIYQSKNE